MFPSQIRFTSGRASRLASGKAGASTTCTTSRWGGVVWLSSVSINGTQEPSRKWLVVISSTSSAAGGRRAKASAAVAQIPSSIGMVSSACLRKLLFRIAA